MTDRVPVMADGDSGHGGQGESGSLSALAFGFCQGP